MKERSPKEKTVSLRALSLSGLLLAVIISATVPSAFVMADNVECIILNCDEGIEGTIKTIISILSVAAGILAAAGITFVGIQYLTAGGNEEKTRKAKRRMIEIVIGLALYAVLATLTNWLLPRGISAGGA